MTKLLQKTQLLGWSWLRATMMVDDILLLKVEKGKTTSSSLKKNSYTKMKSWLSVFWLMQTWSSVYKLRW